MSSTPGPWVLRQISKKFHPSIFTADGKNIVCFFTTGKKADHRLMAAAPELLEALKGLVEPRMEQMDLDLQEQSRAQLLAAARAAIAKAETES